mgnify:CR=1 FL=1
MDASKFLLAAKEAVERRKSKETKAAEAEAEDARLFAEFTNAFGRVYRTKAERAFVFRFPLSNPFALSAGIFFCRKNENKFRNFAK